MTPYRLNTYVAPSAERSLFAVIARMARRARRGALMATYVLASILVLAEFAAAYTRPALGSFVDPPTELEKLNVRTLHAATEAWRANHADDCPTPQRLRDEKELGAWSNVNDAWGNAYEVQCNREETTIISAGPDGRFNTGDDIAFPEPTP